MDAGRPADWFDLASRCGRSRITTTGRALAPVRRSRSPHGGTQPRRSGRPASCTAFRSTSCRTSRPATTRADPLLQDAVLASYRHEFRYMTISAWNRDRLRELGLDAELIPPGIDLRNFRPAAGRAATGGHAAGPRTLEPAQEPAAHDRRMAATAGAAPGAVPVRDRAGAGHEPGIRYVTAPSDEQVNELFNQATVFVQTSVHEGFCLPPLESMATAVPWSARTPTATVTSASTARTA